MRGKQGGAGQEQGRGVAESKAGPGTGGPKYAELLKRKKGSCSRCSHGKKI